MAQPTTMPVTGKTTVTEAREFVKKTRKKDGGCRCPTCGSHRVVKRYRITGRLAARLARLHYLGKTQGVVHIKDWVTWNGGGMDVTILKFYGLIYQPTGPDPDKPFRKSGLWRISQLGRRWLKGEVKMPVYVMVDDMKRIGQSKSEISFKKSFGVKWNPEAAYDPPPKKTKKPKT